VPPLALTGERTLPDVPTENYWFRRHLAAYEWVAERCRGLEVVDMACAEAYEHARLKYERPGVRVVRDLVERYAEPAEAIVFLQTIEHVERPDLLLDRFRTLLRPGGVAYVSTPNVLTLAPPGASRSGNPWHLREYRPEEFRALCRGSFARVELFGLFHARALRAHELALRAGWDALHPRLRLTRPFYERFVPAISARDFRLRPEGEAPLSRALDFVAVLR
jgi:hypothetical protein